MAQAKVITETETFKPITLQVTLETQGEVNALYGVANTNSGGIFKAAESGLKNSDGKIASSSDDWDSVADSIYETLKPHTK